MHIIIHNEIFNIAKGKNKIRTSTSDTITNLEIKPIIVNNYELGATGQIAKWINYEVTSYISTSKLGVPFIQSPESAGNCMVLKDSYTSIRQDESISGKLQPDERNYISETTAEFLRRKFCLSSR